MSADVASQVVLMSQSETEIKGAIKFSGHGGKRVGAGRKPNYLKRLSDPTTAAMILAQHDEIKLWNELLTATHRITVGETEIGEEPDYRIRLDALKYLTDRRDGKAKQAIEHMGPDGGPLQAAVLVKFIGPEGE